MKELSSSNHPTHSSTNIETQISPVNLSQSKKDSSKSDHSTHSPTKNESGVSLKDANTLSKETTNKLSTKRSSPDHTHSPTTEMAKFSINTTTSPQNIYYLSIILLLTWILQSKMSSKLHYWKTQVQLSTKRSNPEHTHSPTTEMEKFSINTTSSPQNDKSSVHNSPVNVNSTIKNESQITLLENTSTIMNIKPQTSSINR